MMIPIPRGGAVELARELAPGSYYFPHKPGLNYSIVRSNGQVVIIYSPDRTSLRGMDRREAWWRRWLG